MSTRLSSKTTVAKGPGSTPSNREVALELARSIIERTEFANYAPGEDAKATFARAGSNSLYGTQVFLQILSRLDKADAMKEG